MKKALAILALPLAGCFFDDAKAKVEEIKGDINSQLASAGRTADGLIKDKALRDSAMQQLRALLPDSLALTSNLEMADSLSLGGKLGKIGTTLNMNAADTTLGALAQCLKALPVQRSLPNPDCYGPSLSYDASKHPDAKNAGTVGTLPNNNQLPPGDLGIWSPTWKNPAGKDVACAAAKTNQLVANASYYPDLAVGSMAMMACVAAFHGDTLPGPGKTLDMTAKLKKLTNAAKLSTPWKGDFESASIANVDGSYLIQFKGVLGQDSLQIKAKHNPTVGAGTIAVLSRQPQTGPNAQEPMQAVSVRYAKSAEGMKVQMASAGYGRDMQTAMQRWTSAIDANGNLNISSQSFDGNLNLMVAVLKPTGGQLAYGWQAGAGDGFLRVFNASVSNGEGKAWFGYAPHTTEGMDKVSSLLTINRLICNWAAPGNTHTGVAFAQRQDMKLDAGVWVPVSSKIRYAPTNDCTVADASVFPTLGAVPQHELVPLNSENYGFVVPSL